MLVGRLPRLLLAVVAILMASIATTQAETQYVTDQLEITMRAGESARYKIIRMLASGTPLEVLDIKPGAEYAKVRAENGVIGYVLASQLQKEPAARTQLAELKSRQTELEQAPTALTARLTALQTEHSTLLDDAHALKQAKQQLEQELATIRHASANVLGITEERDQLRIQFNELRREYEELIQIHNDTQHQIKQHWFMIGASVLIGGILLGLILPHLSFRRRKSRWSSF